VIVDLERIDPTLLPSESAVSALTLAELAAGTHAGADPDELARRQDRLQRTEAALHPIPFDTNAARAYGRVYAAVAKAGRKPRGARAVDLMIAASALAEGVPLFTRNPKDFSPLAGLVDIVGV
jgi:predicted nucleic acid-binding protein